MERSAAPLLVLWKQGGRRAPEQDAGDGRLEAVAMPWRQRGIPVYGVYPYPISHGDLLAMHGNDERVSITGLEQGTDMLTRVLQDALGT